MADQTNTTNAADTNAQGGATLAERAGELRDKAGGLLQSGVDAVKANPGTAAAIVGGVAAAAAAYVGRDKLAETATTVKEKVGGAIGGAKSSSSNDTNKA